MWLKIKRKMLITILNHIWKLDSQLQLLWSSKDLSRLLVNFCSLLFLPNYFEILSLNFGSSKLMRGGLMKLITHESSNWDSSSENSKKSCKSLSSFLSTKEKPDIQEKPRNNIHFRNYSRYLAILGNYN